MIYIYLSYLWVAFTFCSKLSLLCRGFLVGCSPICLFFLPLPLLLVSCPKNSSPRLMTRSLNLIFYSRSFMISSIIFNSLIGFEFIFVYGTSNPVSFFACGCRVFTVPFIKETVHSHCIFLAPFSLIY